MGELIMRQVFIVVGHAGSRKSSIIRALTGAGRPFTNTRQPKIYQVGTTNYVEPRNIHVCHSSLQEAQISPAEFIRRVENLEDNRDVLVALRINGTRNGEFPDAREYASQFRQAGWQIAGVVSLDGRLEGPLIEDTPIPISFHVSENTANNEIAHQIRDEWGWL